jgi:hypothetical protein
MAKQPKASVLVLLLALAALIASGLEPGHDPWAFAQTPGNDRRGPLLGERPSLLRGGGARPHGKCLAPAPAPGDSSRRRPRWAALR